MPVTAAYPNAIPNFSTKTDEIDVVYGDHVNILQAELRAVCTALGTTPQGSAASVKQRLADIETMHEEIESHFDASGLIPQAGVVGLVDALALVLGTYDTKGDLLVASAADTPSRVPVGTAGQALFADPTATAGVAWQGVRFTVPFHFGGALAAGLKAPAWIAPAPCVIRGARARVNAGANATYQIYLNGAAPTGMTTSGVVGAAPTLHDFPDFAMVAGDYIQGNIIAPGTGSELSVTLDATWTA